MLCGHVFGKISSEFCWIFVCFCEFRGISRIYLKFAAPRPREISEALNYIGYTSRHLHLSIEEHTYSVTGEHLKAKHNQRPTHLYEQFTTLKKCRGKFECLIYEMLLIRKKRPSLNTQNDSIPAKLFI